jgi:hypothetical protein
MKRYATLLLAFAAAQASALNVSGFEDLKRDEMAGSRFAKLSLMFYFQGAAETLQAQAVGSKPIYYVGLRMSCPPGGALLTSGLLQAITETEIKDVKANVAGLGDDWRDYQLSAFTMRGLAKTFPCAD